MKTAVASPRDLAKQVGRVCALDTSVLDRARHEALTTSNGWVAEYGEYQSGGWWTLSLFNATGDPSDVEIGGCDPVETSLLKAMPATRELLYSLELRFMWVRLARLSPNSFLWEHRDYGELSDQERYRLHIPLQTNRSAALVLGGAKVNLRFGQLWRLVPTYAHGACNMLGPDRIHLILDCYGDEAFSELAGRPQLDSGDAVLLPAATDTDIARHVAVAARLVELGYRQAAEHSVLRLFYRYALPEGSVYDLLADAYARLGCSEEAAAWRAKKAVLLDLETEPTGGAL